MVGRSPHEDARRRGTPGFLGSGRSQEVAAGRSVDDGALRRLAAARLLPSVQAAASVGAGGPRGCGGGR